MEWKFTTEDNNYEFIIEAEDYESAYKEAYEYYGPEVENMTYQQLNKMSEELYSLIGRLQKCSEINYPNRKWTNEFYYECAFQWKDKIEELKQRVTEIESKTLNQQ